MWSEPKIVGQIKSVGKNKNIVMKNCLKTNVLFAAIGLSLLFSSCSLLGKSSKQFLDDRSEYREIDLQPLSSATSLVGNNPEAIALKTFGISQNANSESITQETVSTSQDSPSNFIVSITQIGLPDDSIKGIRYRLDFVRHNETSSKPEWQMIWAGQQFICQPSRGEQNWTANYCY